jgi:hypothetical protein
LRIVARYYIIREGNIPWDFALWLGGGIERGGGGRFPEISDHESNANATGEIVQNSNGSCMHKKNSFTNIV